MQSVWIQVLYLFVSWPRKMQKKDWAFSSGGERFPDTEEVTSSNLVTPTICDADMAQLVEHHLAKVRVAGSNPVVRSMIPMRPSILGRIGIMERTTGFEPATLTLAR